MNHRAYFATAIALAATVWTAAGETSDPLLGAAELPPDVLTHCDARPPASGCETGLTHHWLGRAAQGELFLVVRAGCQNDCDAWLVQRSARGTRTLLAVSGDFRLVRANSAYPGVQVRKEITSASANYVRYDWNGFGYAVVEMRQVYRVDGVECGTVAECDAAAHAAVEQGVSERAVRIYEQVRGVGFI